MKQKNNESFGHGYFRKLFKLSALTGIAVFGFFFVLEYLTSSKSLLLQPYIDRWDNTQSLLVDSFPALVIVLGLSAILGGIAGIATQFILFGQSPMQFDRHDITLFVLTLFIGLCCAGFSLWWVVNHNVSEFGSYQYPLIGVLSMYGVKYLARWYDRKTGYKRKNEFSSEKEPSL